MDGNESRVSYCESIQLSDGSRLDGHSFEEKKKIWAGLPVSGPSRDAPLKHRNRGGPASCSPPRWLWGTCSAEFGAAARLIDELHESDHFPDPTSSPL